MSFQVYLIRHGQTLLNKYKRFQGWCDAPLTDKGVKDAQMAGKHLQNIKFDAAYHSDSGRAIRTCKIILTENKFPTPKSISLTSFREQGFGYFEGDDSGHIWTMIGLPYGTQNYQGLVKKLGFPAARDLIHKADPFGDAEDSATMWKRITNGFDYLRKHHHDGQKILLVSHCITICTIINHIAPEINAPLNFPKNGSVTKLSFHNNGKITVDYFNHYHDDDNY